MTNIQNIENELDIAGKSEAVRKFYLELGKIKKSNPEKRTVFEKIPDNSSLFKCLLGCGKVIEKTVYTEVNIDGFISINQFMNLLYDYFDFMYFKTKDFIKVFKKKIGIKAPISVELSKYVRYYYFYINSNHNSNKTILEITFDKFPNLEAGDRNYYESVKDEIFEFLPYLKKYCEIYSLLGKISLLEDSCIEIIYKEENDVFKGIYPVLKFCISDVAMIEVSKKYGQKEKYLPYADDKDLIKILQKFPEEIFYSCYLSEDIKLVKLLKDI